MSNNPDAKGPVETLEYETERFLWFFDLFSDDQIYIMYIEKADPERHVKELLRTAFTWDEAERLADEFEGEDDY